MTKEQERQKVAMLLGLYARGPNEEEHECRNCHATYLLNDGLEPAAFRLACAQEFLELLVEHFRELVTIMVKSFETAAAEANYVDANALFCIKTLKEYAVS